MQHYTFFKKKNLNKIDNMPESKISNVPYSQFFFFDKNFYGQIF